MKLKFIIIGLIVLVLGGVVLISNKIDSDQEVSINLAGHDLLVRLAQTPEELAQGLMGVSKLKDNQGMLFVYESDQDAKYWMKGMVMPIDLVWLKNSRVVDFEKNMQPDDGKKVYFSPGPIDQVLEVRAGWIDDYGLKLGDRLERL